MSKWRSDNLVQIMFSIKNQEKQNSGDLLVRNNTASLNDHFHDRRDRMAVTNGIVCVPDLLRGARGFPEGFIDLVREPIRQAVSNRMGLHQDST